MDALRVWAGAPVDEYGMPMPYSTRMRTSRN